VRSGTGLSALRGPDGSLHYHGRVGSTAQRRIAAIVTAVATALVIVAVSIVPFLSPPWVSFEQGRAQADLWTGFTPAELNAATGAILSDLVFGPPDFDVEVNGAPVLNEREQTHMRDVRGVFAGFAVLALVAAVGLVALYAGARRLGHPERWWSAVRAGALGLIVGVVIGGFVAFFAFDAAFEVFHRLFFAGGTYLFDPATDRLVQLFPFAFWSETTMAVGAVIIVLSLAVAFVAGRRARRASHSATAAAPAPVGRPGSEPVS
jgi:integral membrane protein (TIGR01906 family)